MAYKYGLDISEYQSNSFTKDAAWDSLMKSKFKDFIVLRAGFGVDGTEDSCFVNFYHKAKEYGINDISAYWFMYGENFTEAEKEAYNFIRIVEKHGMNLNAMILDIEDNSKWRKHGITLTRNFVNTQINSFIGILKREGLNSAVYASEWVLSDLVDWSMIRELGCGVWNAHYGTNAVDGINGWMWQFTENEYINGWGPFDANRMNVPDVVNNTSKEVISTLDEVTIAANKAKQKITKSPSWAEFRKQANDIGSFLARRK